jgi:LysM repeat protein
MKNARPVLWGIIIVLAVIIFILGAVLLSLVESRIGNKPAPPASATTTLRVPSPTPLPPSATPLNPTDTPTQASNATDTPEISSTPLALSSPTPTAQAEATSVPCKAPGSWVPYVVQEGDTLYRLSQAYGITVAQLQKANCLGTSTLLKVGQTLVVPPWAPQPTIYLTPTYTSTATYPPLPTSLP